MKPSKMKRVVAISRKAVFETGDPAHYVRASDVAFLILELQKAHEEIDQLKSQKPEGGR